MTTKTALRILTQLPAIRVSHIHLSPAALVRDHWKEFFSEGLPEHEIKVWHNTYDTEIDWWAAANKMEAAALKYLSNKIDGKTL